MKSFGCLIIFFSTLAVIDAVAPSDFQVTCRTHHSYRPLHDWIPYANDTSSGTWKVLIDQYDYQNLIGQFAMPRGVWSVQDVDGDGKTFSHGGGGTCLYQIRIPSSYTNPNSNNWLFTQAVDYIDAVELIVNATFRFSACTQRRTAQPPCINDYVILHRYDTNTLNETERINIANYQPYLNNSESSSRLGGDNIIINRFRRPANFNYTYLGLRDIGSIGSVNRIIMYYEVCPRKVEGLATYPEVPHPGRLPGASTRTTRLASCAEHSHNTTSLETYAYQDGRCEQSVTCVCDVGYEQTQQNPHQCIACTAGMYQSALNSSCVNCPTNSNSMMPASKNCSCNAGYYRATAYEGIGVSCTAPPPSISECWISVVLDTGVTLQWRNPPHCGGRSDCYYQIKVNDGSPIRYILTFRANSFSAYTIENLRPDTTYSITISVHNGVSEQDADNTRLRECTIVAKTIRGSVFMLGGITYPNNTAFILEHIGEEDKNSLMCTTAHNDCCQINEQGRFYYPNGNPVLSFSQASSLMQSFYLTHNNGSVSLKRSSDTPSPPLGRYRCEIPNGLGTLQNLYITIGTTEKSECPTISDCPTQQSLTCPPDATPESIPDIHFELNGVILTNNSAVNLNDIGEGERALFCKTNLLNCCGTPPNRFGEFFYPSGDQVPIRIRGEGFYRNRREQSVRLNRRDGTTSPTGRFHCEIPDATGVMKSVYITIN